MRVYKKWVFICAKDCRAGEITLSQWGAALLEIGTDSRYEFLVICIAVL